MFKGEMDNVKEYDFLNDKVQEKIDRKCRQETEIETEKMSQKLKDRGRQTKTDRKKPLHNITLSCLPRAYY